MLKKLFHFFLVIQLSAFSQTNLVPNPSFEVYSVCPNTTNNISDCASWLNFSNSTPDYFNSCSSSGLNVPNSQFGFQFAHSGVGMAGLITWVNPASQSNYREIIGATLSSPLVIGQKYFISCYVNYSGYINSNWRRVASNKIGMKLSTVPYSSVSLAPVNNFSHLFTTVILKDTTSWVKLSGSFVCDSTYQYVIIGNFFDDSNTDTSSYPGPAFGGMASYYYIDDVCVTTDSTYNENWATEIQTIENKSNLAIFPNPITNYLNITYNTNESYILKIIDTYGIVIYDEPLRGSRVDLNWLPSGIYYLRIESKYKNENRKIIKK